MYYSSIAEIPIPFLHDAALTLSVREDYKGNKIYNFRSLYIDPNGECCISFKGRLSQPQIKEVMLNLFYPGEDKSKEDIHPEYGKDYSYENNCTRFYTPDGLDYRNL